MLQSEFKIDVSNFTTVDGFEIIIDHNFSVRYLVMQLQDDRLLLNSSAAIPQLIVVITLDPPSYAEDDVVGWVAARAAVDFDLTLTF